MTILSFLLPLSLAAAANPTCEVADTTIILDEAVVTGLTGLTKMKESPLPTIYVSENTFKSLSGTNVMDKLARFPGVSQITTGGGISKPVVRGLGYNRVVTTDDGVRQEGQQWGDEHGLEIDDSKISSVEILKGPASLMYGSDAIGGVVIMKSNPTLPTGTRMARWASEYQSNNGLLGTSLFAGGNEDGFIWDGHASIKSAHSYKNDEDGYVPNTQFTQKTLDGMVGLSRAWGHSWLKASWFNLKPTMTEEDEGNTLSYNHGYPYQDVSHLKVTSDNSFVAGNGRIIAILAYQMNTRKEFEEGTEPGIHMNLGTLSYDLKYATSESARVRMNYGLNGMYQTNENKGEEALIPDYGLFDAGAFGTASGDFGRWHLSGGLRLDYRHVSTKKVDDKFTEFNKDFSSISASFGAVYDINENMLVKANVARGFRAPNISELGS
nr:TonB-dependent receptor [Bacteroidales bacterium]